jgi:subtilisin family serine protease
VTLGGANAGSSFGHPTTSGDITVGAVDSANTPAFGVNPVAEDFSSSALGSQLNFNPNGTAFSYVPDPVTPISVSGIDDIQTTLPNDLGDFFGTSASAPSVAAVAALMLQANPNLTPTQIDNILKKSTVGMADPNVSGAGLVQADLAVAGALQPQPTNSAIAQLPDGSLDYLQFTGSNLTASRQTSPTTWSIRAEGDFNNDQGLTTQLVAQNPSRPNKGAIDLLYFHNGNLYASNLLKGSYWNVVAAGDFDGSGRTGIATQNKVTGQIDLLWFTGSQLTGSELLNGTFQHVVGAADINGDGQTDLITQNAKGGPLNFLFFAGANLTGRVRTPTSFWTVHDVTNTGTPAQSLMLSQDTISGRLDYLGFNGTSLVSSQLVNGAFPGLTPVQGTQAALNLFPV